MRYLLLLLTIITVCLGSRAERRDSINVWGKVIDLFTGEEIEKGSLTIYDEQDSIVVIDTIHPSKDAYWGTWKYKEQSGYKLKLPKGGQYKVRFDVENIPKLDRFLATKEHLLPKNKGGGNDPDNDW